MQTFTEHTGALPYGPRGSDRGPLKKDQPHGTAPRQRPIDVQAPRPPDHRTHPAQPQLPGHRRGLSTALFFTRLTRRVIIPALAGITGAGPPPGGPLRQADRAYNTAIADLACQASLGIQPRSVTKHRSPHAPVVTRHPS